MPKSILLRLLLAALCLGALVHCGGSTGTDPESPQDPEKPKSPARITLSLGKVGVLSKTSAIRLRKLVLTAVPEAGAADTLRDTSGIGAGETQTVQRVIGLRSPSAWVVHAKTLDERDSVIHAGATAPFTVRPSDTAEAVLALAPRFAMYQALFTDLSDSIQVPGSPAKVAVSLDRLVLRIDGVVRADSALPEGESFAAGRGVALRFDYVTPGSHAVDLEAYGVMDGWSGLLFAGSASIPSASGQDGAGPVTLTWAGPSTVGGGATLILGPVGKVTLVGGFNPML